MEQTITTAVVAAIKALYGQDIPEKMAALQKTRSEFEGNLTLVVFPFLKMSRKKPEETAEEIGEWLVSNCPAVSKFNVVKGSSPKTRKREIEGLLLAHRKTQCTDLLLTDHE